MSQFKKRSSSSSFFSSPRHVYKCLYFNPLTSDPPLLLPHHHNHHRTTTSPTTSALHLCRHTSVVCCDHIQIPKENKPPKIPSDKQEDAILSCGESAHQRQRRPLQPIAEGVQLPVTPTKDPGTNCKVNDDDPGEKHSLLAPSTPNHPLHLWDDPGCEVASASAWSTLSNRSLLCRPLPLDVGRCVCYVVREHENGVDSPTVYSLYTDEGQGRQDRRLAVARHKRRRGRSEFIVAQNSTGILAKSEDGFLGRVRSNLVGTRYFIWDQGNSMDFQSQQRCGQLLGIAMFEPTVTTWTGTYRVMKACIPKYQSMQINNTIQFERNGLSKDMEKNMGKVHQLCSRKPCYNRETKQYELDFRDRARLGLKIKSSVKNFQLIMEENGKQVIMQFGKVGKSKYMMEYHFPLNGYQAFSICLASMDSKLCCSV